MRRRCDGWRTSRLWRLAVCATALAGGPAALAGATPALAIHVEARSCAGVDVREVERLLAIELASLAPAGAIDVTLTCTGSALRMTARDPVVNRALAREVALGPADPDRDRTIALLVSQLFLTSWAEEFLEHPTPGVPSSATALTREQPAPRVSAARWDLMFAAGARVRDWAAPALAEQVSVAGSRGLGRLQLRVTAGFERGSADRAAGSAVWTAGELGAGAGWSWGPPRRLGFSATLIGSAALVRVAGSAASSQYVANSVRGFVGQAELAAGPRLAGDGWRAGLEIELGAAWPTATAQVSGERDVALAGPWTGARLWIGWGRP